MNETEARAHRVSIEVPNPADGKVAGEVPIETAEAVAAKVRELRLFQPEWEAIGPKGRKAWLLRFQDWMIDDAEHIIDVLQSETGKSRVDASIEPTACADLLKYWAGSADKFLADIHPKPHSPLARVKKLTTVYRPHPVVGVITAWNFPFAMPGLDVIPALAAALRCYSSLPR
jgi:acyl-CoA reductase-like NAD-dependent aldehyde dehydrogenase